jgi:multidrug efflux pump subunit AcrA (membrane-fusion protein)
MDSREQGRGGGPSPPQRQDAASAPQPFDLDQVIWRQFAEAATPDAFYRSWLAVQLRMIRGVLGGVVVLGPPDTGPYTPAAFWPEGQGVSQSLAGVADRALAERRGLVIPAEAGAGEDEEGAAGPRLCVAYPVHVSGRLHGVVALEIRSRPERELQTVLRHLQWGAAWIELLWLRGEGARLGATTERLQTVLDLAATALSHERFYGAATAFVTALATGLGCDRVSIGFDRGGRVRVSSVSHSAHLSEQTNLMRAIAAAMDEAIDQQTVVVFPALPNGKPHATRAHEELARQHGAGAICSIPLSAGERFVGALTLERPADQPFTSATVELGEALAALAGPILEIQRRENRWLITKCGVWFRDMFGKIIGPRHMALKLSLAAAAALIMFLAVATGEYRVSATSALEPVIRRAVVAPFAGYIAEASVRAGDLVRRDQVLAALDDRDLRLQRLKWSTQLDQLAKQAQQAQAQRNAAQVVILAAQMDQARAEVALLDDQLGRSRLRAPIEGIVVSGDLSQSLLAPVERGQVLFEVAPLDAFRLILQVDERTIGEVLEGQTGALVLAGAPYDNWAFRVVKITPVSTAREGRNFFRVEATLLNQSERLRPGMEGVGKVSIGERRLVWIWTHDLIEWVRLGVWTWIP